VIKFNRFDSVLEDLISGTHDLKNDCYALVLTRRRPSDDCKDITDIRQIASKGGYKAGGIELDTRYVKIGRRYCLKAEKAVFEATEKGFPTIKYVVLYNKTKGRVIGWWDHGYSFNLYKGETYSVEFTHSMLEIT
jgi:hypothetical protein